MSKKEKKYAEAVEMELKNRNAQLNNRKIKIPLKSA
jgi:hypothetical protein